VWYLFASIGGIAAIIVAFKLVEAIL